MVKMAGRPVTGRLVGGPRRRALLTWAAVLVAGLLGRIACAWAGDAGEGFDEYGGWPRLSFRATGWFHTAVDEGRWWLVDPEGNAFLSIGVNKVFSRPGAARGTAPGTYRWPPGMAYGPRKAWARFAAARLRRWGFNTIGAGSARIAWRQEMPFTAMLDLSRQVELPEGQTFPDVFDPAYESAAAEQARRLCGLLARDRWLIGYFTDDELDWAGAAAGGSLFYAFLGLADDAPGRAALLGFLKERYQTIERLNDSWGTEYESFEQVGRLPQVGARVPDRVHEDFLALVAARYFRTAAQAIRAVDPNHLILGCRFAQEPPGPVLRAMAGYVDVVSVKHCGERPPVRMLRNLARATGLPVIVSEFSLPAAGSPSGAEEGEPEPDARLAERFEAYVRELMGVPAVVGYHWAQYVDSGDRERCGGRGLVDEEDRPHEALVAAAARVNREAYIIASRHRR